MKKYLHLQNKKFLALIFSIPLLNFTNSIFAQEALKSTEEEYYDFLSLQGLTERPTLGYRTLSDSTWTFINENAASSKENIWSANNLGKKITLWQNKTPTDNWFANGIPQSAAVKIYGPEWFNSYNTKAPYGQNDGALWQGRGYNTSLTAGIRAEAYGFELTFKPQLSFSQNAEFEIKEYDGQKPEGLSKYSYFWGPCDAVQRFGNKPFFTFDWGDSEVRYSWNTFTFGFGTQAIWLGPAVINPLLHSNNAATYPKFDFGLRKTEIIIPKINWNIGKIEARVWLGYLSESEYFDEDPDNNHHQFTCFSFYFSPSFLSGFTVGVNKVCIAPWNSNFWKYLNPFYNDNDLSATGEDMKASITADWNLPASKLNLYCEIGIDDHVPDHGLNIFYGYNRYPFHTMTFTTGLKKAFEISKEKELHGLLNFEYNTTEMSQDFQLQWPYNFGFHSRILQGYTNKGQWIGSGIGYGGNSQYLSFSLYSPRGVNKLFIGRNNPDNSYIFSKAVYATAANYELAKKYFTAFKANFYTGIEGSWFAAKSVIINYGFTFNFITNPLYDPGLHEWSGYYRGYSYWLNFNFKLGVKYSF